MKPKKRKAASEGREKKDRSAVKRAKLPRKKPGEEGYDPYDFTSSESEGEELAPPTATPTSQPQDEAMDTGPVTMSASR